MSSSVTIDQLLTEPEFMLLNIDFRNDRAIFCRIPPTLPNDLCESGQRYPSVSAPLSLILDSGLGYEAVPLPPLHFIWMTDFCGSTLLAKGLNQVSGLYLYHEPRIFFDLAMTRRFIDAGRSNYPLTRWRAVLRFALRQQAKVFKSGDIALVKEWPMSNYILHDILGANEDYRGLFLYGGLKDYLSKVLKSQNRRQSARTRVSKLLIEISGMHAFSGVDLANLSDAQAAALHWLYLMYWHRDNNYANHPQLRALASDDFFADPAGALRKSASYFGRPIDGAKAEQILAGSLFTHHSKQSGLTFSMQQRAIDDARAEQEFAPEITAGLEWAQRLIDRSPLPSAPGPELADYSPVQYSKRLEELSAD